MKSENVENSTFIQSEGTLDYRGSKIVESVNFQVINQEPGRSFAVYVTADKKVMKSDPLKIIVTTQDIPVDHAAETRVENGNLPHTEFIHYVSVGLVTSAVISIGIIVCFVVVYVRKRNRAASEVLKIDSRATKSTHLIDEERDMIEIYA